LIKGKTTDLLIRENTLFPRTNFSRLLPDTLMDHSFDKTKPSWMLGAHTWNPSYSGSRAQEDGGSKPALANSSRDPISKIPNTK
jgi:hypothetical protein